MNFAKTVLMGCHIKTVSIIQNQYHILEQTAQAIFQSWFVNFDGVTEWDDSELGKIPKGWSVKQIKEILDEKGYIRGPFGSSLKRAELKSEGGSITEGIGSSRVTANFAEAKIDGAFSISDHESLPILYDLIQNEGLSLGTSCGVNIAGAIKIRKRTWAWKNYSYYSL